MKTAIECIPCFVRQAAEAVERATRDRRQKERILKRLLHDLARTDWNLMPVSISQHIHRRVRTESGQADPYRTLKDHMNRTALDLLPRLSDLAKRNPCPREAVTRLAIAGNLLDAGSKNRLAPEALSERLETIRDMPLVIEGDDDMAQEQCRMKQEKTSRPDAGDPRRSPSTVSLDPGHESLALQERLDLIRHRILVMSMGFLLQDRDDAVIWRGPMKMGVIQQFLKDVAWGDLDFLVIDAPPGTGDEPLSVAQLAAPLDGAVIVTTPQDVATADVRKSITFCRQLKIPVLGVVENMSGFVCPECGTVTYIFKAGGGERMAADMGVPFLGRIPIDPVVSDACDRGRPFVEHHNGSETAKAFERVVTPVLALLNTNPFTPMQNNNKSEGNPSMKIAIPVVGGKLCMHFGHCEQFALLDVDPTTGTITGTEMLAPPAHEPGVLPRWLHQKGAEVIIAGGMGQRAQSLFAENGIRVVVGAVEETPAKIAAAYLAGTLQTGVNVCDH